MEPIFVRSRSAPPELFDGCALDLDGTAYLGETLLPEAAESVVALRTAGRGVVFLSNNPLQTRAGYQRRD